MLQANTRFQARSSTQVVRRPPTEALRLYATFDGRGALGNDLSRPPTELFVEATNRNGELAPWFDDLWWTDLVRCWGEAPIAIHLAPTKGALLHPVVLRQAEMVHRVSPRWRFVGYAYVGDLPVEEDIRTLARSAYDEVRFLAEARPGVPPAERQFPLEELFSRIRFEQVQVGANRPVPVRLPSQVIFPSPPIAVPTGAAARV